MGDSLLTNDVIAAELGVITSNPIACSRLPTSKKNYSIQLQRLFNALPNKSWQKTLLNRYSLRAELHLSKESKLFEVGSPTVRVRPHDDLLGNLNVWKTVRYLMDSPKFTFRTIKDVGFDIYDKNLLSISSNLYRLGEGVTKQEKNKLYADYVETVEYTSTCHAYAQHLRYLHNAAIKRTNSIIPPSDQHYTNTTELDISLPKGAFDYYGIDLSVIGSLVLIKIGDFTTIMTNIHFYRLLRLLEQFASLVVSARDLSLRVKGKELPEELIRIFWPVIESDVDILGEVLKGIRTILIARLDTFRLWDKESSALLLNSLSSERRYWIKETLSDFSRICKTSEDAINLSNFYRAVPHPDANLTDIFDSIKGFQNPNRHSPGVETRFEATLRKTLYESMVSQGYDVRLRSTGDLGRQLDALSVDTEKSISRILHQPYTSWSQVEFLPVRNVPDVNQMFIRPISKASQLAPEFTQDELDDSKRWSAGLLNDRPDFIRDSRTINDVSSVLKGESKLEPAKAIKRLERCIRLHEEFEAKFPNRFPEDIPSADFEKFIKETPDARYVIGTEPKFGEVHKKVTRMFYIAEQELKAITQRVERLGKQLARKSTGVSIVKSYAGRRKDLENFCRNMTGSDSETLSIFVSFDMSEFSKKFPMELVRIYGKILSEITGVEWLRRIDIIFRSAFVIHNSRGFFDYITGVKGGFEGFLNFGWSTIHATIMRIALESTGLEGELLTFSDDGLLCFYVPRNTEKSWIRDRVKSVQTVYSDHGLEFKMAKTLIATNVWEYLGDVCHNNHLLNMWVKELMSIGRNEVSSGIEPFSHQLDSVEGQSDACIAAGANPLTVCIIKRSICSMRLRRIGSNLPVDLEECLFLVPKTAGGFRLKSAPECCILSTIESDSEFIADLVLLSREKRRLSAAILKGLLENSEVLSKPIDGIMRGSRFVSKGMDTSGYGVLNEAVEIAKQNAVSGFKLVSNPARSSIGRRLNDILPLIENITPKLIMDLILSTPEWAAYSDSIALVKGRGAIRIISRKDLKRLQAKDTRRCKDAIKTWREIIESNDSTNIDLNNRIDKIVGRTMRGLSLAPLRPSPRIVIKSGYDRANVLVEIDELDAKSVASAVYREPSVVFPTDVTTLSWYAERGGNRDLNSMRKFLVSVARFIAHSPDSEYLIRVLAAVVDIDVPSVPIGVLRGAHRRGTASSISPDMRVLMPRAFDALSTFRYIGELGNVVYELEHADRRTMGEAARVISSIRWFCSKRCDQRLTRGHYTMAYKIEEEMILPSFQNTPSYLNPDADVDFNPQPLPDDVRKEYNASFIEFSNYLQYVEMVDNLYVGTLKENGFERVFYELAVGKALEGWIIGRVRSRGSVLAPDKVSPLPMLSQTRLCEKSIIRASYRLLEATERRSLADVIHKYTIENSLYVKRAGNDRYAEGFDAKRDEFLSKYAQAIWENAAFKHMDNIIMDCCDLCMYAGVPGTSKDTARMVTQFGNIVGVLAELLRHERIVKGGFLTVVRPERSIITGFSSAHKRAYREAYTHTISYLYGVFSTFNWNERSTKDELGFEMQPDQVLDCVTVFRSLLRESDHRGKSHPANLTTSRIELWKFYRAAYTIVNFLNTEKMKNVSDNDIEDIVRDWRPDDKDIKYLKRELAKHRTKELGPDHTNLLSTGIKPDAVRRCRIIIGKYSRSRGGYWSMPAYEEYGLNMSLTEVIHQCTEFYNTFTTAVANSIIEYPVQTERLILDRFAPSTSQLSCVFGAQATCDKIYGELINPKELRPRVYESLSDILSSHLKELAFERRIIGFSTTNFTHRIVHSIISNQKCLEGPTVKYLCDLHVEADYTAYLFRMKSATVAINSYINLAKIGSAAIFRDDLEEGYVYYVSGIASQDGIQYQPESSWKKPNVKILTKGDTPEFLVPTVSFSNQAKNLGAIISARVNRGGVMGHRVNPLGYTLTFASSTGRNLQSNSESELLQGAVFASQLNSKTSTKVGCYAAVVLWLHGKEDAKLIPALVKKMMNSPPDELSRIKLDIGLVFAWLICTNAHPARNLSHEKIMEAQRTILSLSVKTSVAMTVTERDVRQIEGLKEASGFIGMKIGDIVGNVNSRLYYEALYKFALEGPAFHEEEVDPEAEDIINDLY